jgi:hypothetical protein
MPERVLRKVWDYFDTNGPLIGGLQWPITYRKEEAERAALLRVLGLGEDWLRAVCHDNAAGLFTR